MRKVILQPIGNYNSIDDFKENNSKRWAEKKIYKSLWEESEEATVLFTHNGVVFAKATILSIENSGHSKYPLDYFYNDIEYIDVAFSKIRDLANFSSPYRTYTVLDEKASQKIIDYFELSKLKIYKKDEDYQKDINNASLIDIKDEPEVPRKPKEKGKKKNYPRNVNRAKLALYRADYQCEIDDNHKTFISKSSKESYVEAHHLIPFKVQVDIDYNLDVTHNIISLCPNCHRKIHFGFFEDKKEMLKTLYNKHILGLETVHLDIGLDSLYSIYSDFDLHNE